jgi:penicillin-binding protein 2
MTESSFSRESRARILVLIFGLFLFALTGRLFVMQTMEHEKYYLMSEENRIRIVPEVSFRGIVYDRNGEVIVENRPLYTISAIPNELEDIQKICAQLARVIPLSAEEISDKIYAKRFLRYRPVRIARGVSFETICRIEENADKYPGIIFQLEPARKYPPNGLISHVTGYTGEISEAELEELKGQGINRGTDIGRDGIEKYWDKYLRGRDGISYFEITAEGKIVGNLPQNENIPATPGRDMILSLDYELQQYAASIFGDTLSGACVAVDPRNGEVLVFVSAPSYDANLFSGVTSQEDLNAVLANPQKPLLNRVIRGVYPPGSTYKLMLAGAGLEEGVIDRNTKFAACRGGYRFGNRVFHCWYLAGHGSLGVVDAIIQSCDIYFYQMGQKLGLEKFAAYSRKCGFGSRTGIDIPGEQSGLVPDQDWYDRKYGRGKWPISVILNLSIGQGEILTTPLQLANFYAALGNGGTLYRPHFLRKAILHGDTVETKIEILGHLPFSGKTLAILKESCEGVLYGEHGTARGSQIQGIRFGGKTGTAQNPHGDEHAWFCAYAPSENPIIAVTVIAENAGHGSEAAAPIASKIIRRYLEKNNIIPRIDTTGNLAERIKD